MNVKHKNVGRRNVGRNIALILLVGFGLVMPVTAAYLYVTSEMQYYNVDFWSFMQYLIPEGLLRLILIMVCAIVIIQCFVIIVIVKNRTVTNSAPTDVVDTSSPRYPKVGRPPNACDLAKTGLITCPFNPDAFQLPAATVDVIKRKIEEILEENRAKLETKKPTEKETKKPMEKETKKDVMETVQDFVLEKDKKKKTEEK